MCDMTQHLQSRTLTSTCLSSPLVTTPETVMSQIRMSHVTRMSESRHTHESVTPHMDESWYTYAWVMSHVLKSHVTYTQSTCLLLPLAATHHPPEWVMAHTWMTHVCERESMRYSTLSHRSLGIRLNVSVCVCVWERERERENFWHQHIHKPMIVCYLWVQENMAFHPNIAHTLSIGKWGWRHFYTSP